MNILVLATEGIAIFILWSFPNKKGDSNTAERKALIDRIIKLFGKERIYLTGGREF